MSKDKREDDTKKIVREEEPTLGEGPDSGAPGTILHSKEGLIPWPDVEENQHFFGGFRGTH